MGACHGHKRKGKKNKNYKAPPVSAGYYDTDRVKAELFYEINEIRQTHQVGELQMARDLNNIAQSHSNKLARNAQLEYSDNKFRGEELGEILFYYSTSCSSDVVIDSWNKDSKTFKYNKKNSEASPFAQLVWKSSQYIGIGISQDTNGGTYIVANFYPAGNVSGQFKDNVFPPKYGKKKTKKEKKAPAAAAAPQDTSSYQRRATVSRKTTVNCSNFEAEALNQHNYYRRKHHVGPLTLNRDLSKIAQNYANKLAATNTFGHSTNKYKGNNLGENLYTCFNKQATGAMATDSWYSEIKDHNFRKDFQSKTGHFTQLVWKTSEQVGFGIASRGERYFVVANYYPAGNTLGQFHQNVFKA